MKVADAKIIDIPKIEDRRGNLSVVEEFKNVPFHIARAYWLYDVPAGAMRGGHAHKRLKQLLIALSGSFTVTLNDGHEKRKILLNRPYQGLLIETGIWRTMTTSRRVRCALCSPLSCTTRATTSTTTRSFLNIKV